MIKNGFELTEFLCKQAQDSGFAKACIIVVLDNDGSLHRSEFGLVMKNKKTEDNAIQMISAEDVETKKDD